MKHRPAPLLSCGSRFARQIAARATPALLIATVIACDDARATLVVLSDTTAAPASRVVVALSFDPATLPIAADAHIPDGPRGDSVRLAIARHDSASQVDATFQRVRTAANDAARALIPLDRTDENYAARYSAWTAIADSAERLRATRDRLRERIRAINMRLGAAAPDLNGNAPRTRSRASADSAARAAGHELKTTTLRSAAASVSVPAGEWWIAATTAEGALIVPAQRTQVGRGETDTVVLWTAPPER